MNEATRAENFERRRVQCGFPIRENLVVVDYLVACNFVHFVGVYNRLMFARYLRNKDRNAAQLRANEVIIGYAITKNVGHWCS